MIDKLSEMGAHHRAEQGENQDFVCYDQNRNYCVISLADGVSTCTSAKIGAEIAAKSISEGFMHAGNAILASNCEEAARYLLGIVQTNLQRCARQENAGVEDYSSTLASVFIDKKKKRAMCFSLGDSLIMGVENGKCRVLAMPSDSRYGCYTTTTLGAENLAVAKIIDITDFQSILICSDGAWTQMFDKNRLKKKIFNLLVNDDFEGLKTFLTKEKCFDDYSFIALTL